MEYQDYYDKFYHKVTGVTGVCVYKTAMHGEEYPLTIGQTYNVRYLAMFRSCSRVVLEGDRREYQSHCFKLCENGKPLEITAERFTAPYLRDWHVEDDYRFDKIPRCLNKAAEEYKVHILWTALRGSRKWGYSFPKSDWDIWFLYCHEPKWYDSASKTDAIEQVYEGNIDMVGWDIIKSFEEMKKGNPLILNWLTSRSDWTKDNSFIHELMPLIPQCFDAKTATAYYYNTHIALNDIDYKNCEYSLKQFFYYLRGILSCKWIEEKNSLPPYVYKMYEELLGDSDISHEIRHIWYILTLRVPREGYKVSSQLIDYAKEQANYYKQIALGVSEFKVPDDICKQLDAIAEKTVHRISTE